jgi:hypothetical protein
MEGRGFKVLCQYLPGGTENRTKKVGQGSWSPRQDLNPVPSEYEAKVVII